MHLLWLASWYPKYNDPFQGDFIQRHARAVALTSDVNVIHVSRSNHEPTVITEGGRTERIWYYRELDTRIRLLDLVVNAFRAFGCYRKAFRDHVRAKGKPELVHVHVCMKAGVFALWLRFRYGIPYVVTEHFSAYIPGTPDDFYTRSHLYQFLNRLILRKALNVHTVSRFLGDCLQKASRIKTPTIISNTVNTSIFHPGPQTPGDGFRFIHVSSFDEGKNVRAMLEAFALLLGRRKDWELVLVGRAGYPIQSWGDALGLTAHLHWTGEVPYASVASWMQRSQALVHFSQFETQSCVVLEALCCGLPVVSSAVGGIPEILNSDNALLVPADEKKVLALALNELMDNYDRFDRARIASEAAASYAYPVIGRQFEEFYASSSIRRPNR